MKKLWKKLMSTQAGSTTTTSLLILSGVAAATAAITDLTRRLKQNNEGKDEAALIRRANESAINAVSQLVNSGALHYNDQKYGDVPCNRLEPAQALNDYTFSNGCSEIKSKSDRTAVNCSSTDEKQRKWLYIWDTASKRATVQICVRTDEPTKYVNVAQLLRENPNCKLTDNRTIRCDRRVNVTVIDHVVDNDDSNLRNYMHVKAQPHGRTSKGGFYSSLNGKISLGLTSGNVGLVSRHGAADTCYYMRPAAKQESRGSGTKIAFLARNANKEITINDLEPRKHGPNADEFQGTYNVAANIEDYSVLGDFRDQILKKYYEKDYRGNRPETDSWDENNSSAFIPKTGRPWYSAHVIQEQDFLAEQTNAFLGVQPNIPNGPQFRYFLAARPGTSEHHHSYTVWNPKDIEWYKQGCKTSAGDANATFCTRVDVPLKRYTASVNNKCKLVPKQLAAGYELIENGKTTVTRKVAYADRAVQTSCDKKWIDLVKKIIAEEEQKVRDNPLLGNYQDEVTAAMAISAFEVDDDFLKGAGKWANHRLRKAYSSFVPEEVLVDGAKIIDDFTIEYESPTREIEEKVVVKEEKISENEDGTTKIITEEKIVTKKIQDGKKLSLKIYTIDEVKGQAPEVATHESQSCAYFKYYDPTNAKACRIDYVTRQTNKTFVCRNNDGCFDVLTKIRMADGSDRLITELSKGEYVYNPVTRKPAKIVKLTMGPENKPLLHITIGNSTVRVTDTHPFMTKRGWVAARHLKAGELVLSSENHFVKVEKVTLGQSGRMVANLALEGPANEFEKHYVLADGVVTGDLVIQNMLESKAAANKGIAR